MPNTSSKRFKKLTRALATLVLAIGALLTTVTPAWACPTIESFVDYTCDGKIRIGFLGDSFVAGRGDTMRSSQRGYVSRLAARESFSKVQIVASGLSGYTTKEILIEVQRSLTLNRPNRLSLNLRDLDYVTLDLGRNDFFKEISPATTAQNIRLLARSLNQNLSRGDIAPLIITAKMPLTSSTQRPLQRSFISLVDRSLERTPRTIFPLLLPFNSLPSSLLSSDGLHPSPSGHQFLSNIAAEFFQSAVQEEALRQRPDSDSDGVYDFAEVSRFKTDPGDPDTDGDTLGDGTEIFTTKTNPLASDSDQDGFGDSTELTAGSDANDPLSFP